MASVICGENKYLKKCFKCVLLIYIFKGISIVALTAVEGFGGLVIFSWVYGFALGGYNYALKVYTFERVRARHFPRAWSFVQWSQAIPLMVGVPLTGKLRQLFILLMNKRQ
jgi:predicted MFS family arabinose efflux permease